MYISINLDLLRSKPEVEHRDLDNVEPRPFTVARINCESGTVAIMLPYGSRLSIVRPADIVP